MSLSQSADQLAYEQRALGKRIDEFTEHVTSEAFRELPRAERSRRLRQLLLMEQLDKVLLERLDAAKRIAA